MSQFQRALDQISRANAKRFAPKEKDIARTCCDYLRLDGWRILNCEPVSRKEWGRGFGEKGMPDTIAIRYFNESAGDYCANFDEDPRNMAEIIWIEWKTPSGRLEAHQRTWHQSERARGAFTLIAGEDFEASIDGFLEYYRNSSLNRGKV